MPKESLSVYLSAVDRMSPVLASITDKTKALDKESQELQQTYEALQQANKGLIAQKTELQKKLQEVNKEVKEAKKNFEELGDEANADALNKATEKQQSLKDQIAATTKALQENQKIYKENIETIRKGGMEAQGTGLSDIAKGLFAGQIGQMFSSSLGGLGQSLLTSAIGTPEASLISDALSSAISGGAAGAMFGPGGIAAGAVLGGVSGLISGGTKIFEAKNDAFKDYYGGLYQEVSGRSGEMVESGSTLASGRQTDRISFKTLFGDKDTANAYLENLVDMANHTPFLYDDLVSMSKTLATYGYSPDEEAGDYILDALQTIGDAGAALGLGAGDMTAVAQALGRMKSSGKATLEYLNILNDRGIGAVGMLADAKGISQGDMYGMISKGQISGTEAVEIISAALREAYYGAMEEQSQTFAGISSTLEGLEQEMENAGGEGYNTLRESGKSAMVDAYQGELGESIKEINRIMGENQARKENLQDQYVREALDAVLNGNRGKAFNEEQSAKLAELAAQFAEAKQRYEDSAGGDAEAGAKMEALYEEAQLLGQAYFDNSDFVKTLNETELDEIEAIQQATSGLENAYTALYDLNQTMSKGLAVRWTVPGTGGAAAESVYIDERGIVRGRGSTGKSIAPAKESGTSPYIGVDGVIHYHAFGLDRVPYDDYPALLHEGERVLTAAEARAQDAGAGSPISLTITGNSFTGTSEEMADQLWEIIVRKLERAYTAAAPK